MSEDAGARRWWPAPGKLNLFLHVTGRRADGYHLLQTIFQFIEAGDRLRFYPRSDGEIHRVTCPHLPAEDLCVRAARVLQEETGYRGGVDIELEKNLPAGAGLGGGSSDAATVLLVLNHLWRTGLSRSRMMTLGARLGADVPVFVAGQASWAEGIGEILTPVSPAEEIYCIAWPHIEAATAEIFADRELTRNSPNITIRGFLEGGSRNDLEAVTRRRYPEVDELLRWLQNFGDARMTGSGAAAFVAVPTIQRGEEILRERPANVSGFVTQAINRHPLMRLTPAF